MQLKELSRQSGTSAASIKYYLREGLLPAGENVHATRAQCEWDCQSYGSVASTMTAAASGTAALKCRPSFT